MKHAPNREIGELPDSPPAPQRDADALINGQTSLSADLFCRYFLILKFNPILSTPRPPKRKNNQTTPLGFGSSADLGPGRNSVKSCLFNKKTCNHIGFARATDLSDIFKNERNAPNAQRYRHLKLPSSGPRQNVTKQQKSF